MQIHRTAVDRVSGRFGLVDVGYLFSHRVLIPLPDACYATGPFPAHSWDIPMGRVHLIQGHPVLLSRP